VDESESFDRAAESRRSRLVSDMPALMPPDSAVSSAPLILANFQHADGFWFAVIDLSRVREVLVQMEHTGQLNHGQVRVTSIQGMTRCGSILKAHPMAAVRRNWTTSRLQPME
jgi:hypothetical protein